MRLTTVNPLPFRPTTPVEHQLCEKVAAASGEVVLQVLTPETYLQDERGQRLELLADFEVRTGALFNGLFVGGSVYLGYLRDGQIDIEWDGSWT